MNLVFHFILNVKFCPQKLTLSLKLQVKLKLTGRANGHVEKLSSNGKGMNKIRELVVANEGVNRNIEMCWFVVNEQSSIFASSVGGCNIK